MFRIFYFLVFGLEKLFFWSYDRGHVLGMISKQSWFIFDRKVNNI